MYSASSGEAALTLPLSLPLAMSCTPCRVRLAGATPLALPSNCTFAVSIDADGVKAGVPLTRFVASSLTVCPLPGSLPVAPAYSIVSVTSMVRLKDNADAMGASLSVDGGEFGWVVRRYLSTSMDFG